MKTDWIRVVGFNRNPRNEEMVPVIITWDTADRARCVLEEYGRLEEKVIKHKASYRGSEQEEVDRLLGRVTAFKSKREQRQDDEFFEMTRHTNNMNVKLLKECGDKSYGETRSKILGGEWDNLPKKNYITRRGNESKGPNTFQLEYTTFKATRGGDKDREWTTMVKNQIKYVDAGIKRGTVKGENSQTAGWLLAENKKNHMPK